MRDDRPSARVVGPAIDRSAWDELTTLADPEPVTFADRPLELAWRRRVLGYGDVGPRLRPIGIPRRLHEKG
jgi:hypothetical protein